MAIGRSAHLYAVICGLALAIASSVAAADPSECREAINAYDSARSDVSDALRAYAHCIADSQGHDDCSSEFSRLHSAHDDFESAVSQYETACS